MIASGLEPGDRVITAGVSTLTIRRAGDGRRGSAMNTGPEAKFNLSAWALKNQQMVSFFMLLVIAMGVFCYESCRVTKIRLLPLKRPSSPRSGREPPWRIPPAC
jgi:hypothetical protein